MVGRLPESVDPARAPARAARTRCAARSSTPAPAAREQITIALALVDAHDARLVPLDTELRDYAKRQPAAGR
jgi:hypothetical protein